MFQRFMNDVRGNFAVMTAVLAVPLLLSIGLYIDYARQSSARVHLQALADLAAINMASSREEDDAKLRVIALNAINGNADPQVVQSIEIERLEAKNERIRLDLHGIIDTTFMQFGNIMDVGVRATAVAERGLNGQVEVALVLDNTYSMKEADSSGGTKMSSLKSAASELVKSLLKENASRVKISIVPYADYVNVGTANRSASWLNVAADYSTTTDKVCVTKTTKSVCVATAPTYACTKVTDGVIENATCGGGCTKYETQTVAAYESCSGGSTTNYKWYGCVGSRTVGDTRLDDKSPTVRYPGYLATSQLCPTAITELTNAQTTLLTAISKMAPNVGSYKPYTYIPAGLIWGQNVLSPTAPFTDGKEYDPSNIAPRKVVVLMTDGDNTLRFNQADGKHIAFTTGKETEQRAKTDQDTRAICEYMRTNNVEVYSVAFMVDNTEAKSLLEDCATDKQHYFDASDATKLLAAFQTIAQSLTMVRLAQ